MTIKDIWKSVEKISAIAAFLLALPAFIISIRSCSISQRALEFTESDFLGARVLILSAKYDKQKDVLFWNALGDQLTLQSMRIIFPPSLGIEPWPVLPPDWGQPVAVITNAIQKNIAHAIKRPPKDMSLVALNRMLPIIIESIYIAKGQLINARSCYDVLFDLSYSDRQTTPPQIDYRAAVFVANAPELSPSHLDKMWQNQLEVMQKSDAIR